MRDLSITNLQEIKPRTMTRDEYRARKIARAKFIRLKKRRRNLRIASTLILSYIIVSMYNYSSNKATTNQGMTNQTTINQASINQEMMELNDQSNTKTTTIKSIYGLSETENPINKPDIQIDHLPINPISRPGNLILSIDYIVIHYVGNPGTTANQNRSYYEEIIATMEASVSSNYLIGLDGEIIECVPSYEVAYASNHMNSYSVSIEASHLDESGEFNDATYKSMVELTAWLCGKYELTSEDLLRHYDVTGKECPKSFVDKPALWEEFKKDVKTLLNTKE